MNEVGFISSILSRYTESNASSFYREPGPTVDPLVGCWRAWAATRYLQQKGEWQRANMWINIAARLLSQKLPEDEKLLRAEVLGLAGRLLYTEGDVGDALVPLIESCALWEELSKAWVASEDTRHPLIKRLADQVRGMLQAFDPEHKILPEKALVQNEWLVKTWESECMLESWATTAATLGRALAASGRHNQARAAVQTMKDWMTPRYYQLPDINRIRQDYEFYRQIHPELFREDESVVGFHVDWSSWHEDSPPTLNQKLLFQNLKTLEKLERYLTKLHVSPAAALPLWRLAMSEGDIDIFAGDLKASLQAFAFAVQIWDDNVVNYTDQNCVGRALFNQASVYIRLERYAEARQICTKYIENFGLYDPEGTLRVRHADLFAKWKLNPKADIESEARGLLAEWEKFIVKLPDRKFLHIDKTALTPIYEMLLVLLARQGSLEAAIDYTKIIQALREGHGLSLINEMDSMAEESKLWPDSPQGKPGLDPLKVLAAYVARLPRTVVLILQSAAGELTYLALRDDDSSNRRDLEDRLLLGVASTELSNTFAELLEHQDAELEAILTGRMPDNSSASNEIIDCCTRAWQLLPKTLRIWLETASTILYCPDPFGRLDEVPLELFRTSQGWLGTKRTIARQFSLATLGEMLSPNGLPRLLEERAYVLRTEDLPGFDPLPDADLEADQVMRYLGLIGLNSVYENQPTAASLRQVLDHGYRIVHYVGHGLAGGMSEGLPLTASEMLQPRDLTNLSGYLTPFVYLSACEVGRTRYISGGKQTGMAVRLVEKGAPAVVGCLQTMPDRMGKQMAVEFYRAAKTVSAGEALRIARRRLDQKGIHPACWGLFVLYGDPFITLSSYAASKMRQASHLTADWSSSLIRWLAVQYENDRQECLTKLQIAQEQLDPSLAVHLEAVAAWVRNSFKPVSKKERVRRLKICSRLARLDLAGGVALRLLQEMEIIRERVPSDGSIDLSTGRMQQHRAANDLPLRLYLSYHPHAVPGSGDWDELQIESRLKLCLDWSARMYYGLAWSAFAAIYCRAFSEIISPRRGLEILKEAARILDAWSHLAPEYALLRDQVYRGLGEFQKATQPGQADRHVAVIPLVRGIED